MNSPDPNERIGSLERMGIPVETVVDQNILTPSSAKAVRFRVSKPSGYAFNEVDSYMQNIVNPSIEWYVTSLHQRDRAVHALGTALDQAETTIENLRGQIQFLDYNSSAKAGLERGADDKEMVAVMQKLEEANAEIARLRANGVPTQNNTASEQQIAELEAYIEQIRGQYEELYARYESDTAELQAQLTAALNDAASSNPEDGNRIQELETYAEQIRGQYEELYARYESDTAELQQRLDAALQEAAVATPVVSNEDAQRIIDLESHIGQITEQYNELYRRYETDTEELQKQLVASQEAAASSNLGASAEELAEAQARIKEYEAYVEQITNQYNELYTQYEALANQTSNDSSNEEELESLRAENLTLHEKIAQLEEQLRTRGVNSSDDLPKPKPKSGISFATEDRNRTIDTNKYGDLPPGILPSDLE